MSVTINATNFPDAQFRAIVSKFDANHDGTLSDAEIAACTRLHEADFYEYDSSGQVIQTNVFKDVKSYKGIQYLTSIQEINISKSVLTDDTIDLSALANLKRITFFNMQGLKTLIIHGTALEYMWATSCRDLENIRFINAASNLKGLYLTKLREAMIHELDLSSCVKLEDLQLVGNTYKRIDIRQIPRLLVAYLLKGNGDVPHIEWKGSNGEYYQVIECKRVFNAGYNTFVPEDNDHMSTYRIIYDPDTNIITDELTITEQPTDAMAADQANASFHCSASGTSTVAYEWQYRNYFTNMASSSILNWTMLGNEQNLTIKASSWLEYHVFRNKVFLPSSLQTYYAVDKQGQVSSPKRYHIYNYTDVAHLKVLYPVKITKHPEDSINIVGKISDFRVIASNTPPTVVNDNQTQYKPDRTQATITYQWQSLAPGASDYSDIPGANTSTYSVIVKNDYNNYKYRCKVSDGTTELISSPAKLIVVDNLDGRPSVTKQPEDISIKEGTEGIFSVEAFGENLSYSWECSSDGENWDEIRYATNSSCSVYAIDWMTGYRYRCKISNDKGSAYSNAAILTVIPDTRLAPPEILTQPSSVSVTEGATVRFEITAQGPKLHYQWQTYQDGNWYNINGATSDYYSITASYSQNGKQYRCQVSNSAGTVNSFSATAYVAAPPVVISTPVITNQPQSTAGVEGFTVSFRITAKGGSLSYQWQIKRGNSWYDITGANNPIYSIRVNAGLDRTQYRCRVSNSAGTVYSSLATLTVRELGPLPMYGYHSIIISGKNTYGEWEMYPTSRPHVAPPEVKTSYVDVPGADGGLDYTELLNEKPNYGYRKGSWEFLLIPQERWPDVYRSLCNYLHGREHTVVLEDDPNVMYTGRLSVNQWQSAAHNSLITIDYILDPEAINTQDESYNPDELDFEAAERILKKSENTDCVLSLVNNQITIVPKDSLYEDGDNITY